MATADFTTLEDKYILKSVREYIRITNTDVPGFVHEIMDLAEQHTTFLKPDYRERYDKLLADFGYDSPPEFFETPCESAPTPSDSLQA